MQALVSIIMPIYNSELFLQKALQSILNQTYTNLQIICLNDGSTDGSIKILESFQDKRIQIINQPINTGLIKNLNEGLQLAQGEFIARMDADDIATIDRIEKQVHFLQNNQNVFAVASTIQCINEKEEKIKNWDLDRNTITPSRIKKAMFSESCIAHPTVMFRKEIKSFSYPINQKHCEDYALWLDILSSGKMIGKINEPLLLYRVHSNSVTETHLRKVNPFFKLFHCKRRFLQKKITELNWTFFESQLFFYMILDGIKGIAKEIKKSLK